MRIILPFGFYGWGNIGDEATLNGFAQLLRQSADRIHVSAGSRNPAHTALVEPAFRYFSATGHDPRRWWAKLRATGYAVVGGTPIMDVLGEWPLSELAPIVRSVDRYKVPLVFVGVGVEHLQLNASRSIVAEEILPRVRHWSVRSGRDRQRLLDYGASPENITVAADLAWLIEPSEREFGREQLRSWGLDPEERLIGVNLVNENSTFDRHPAMVDALATALDALAEQLSARVVFLSNEVREGPLFDKSAAQKVMSRMRHTDRAVLAPNEYWAPRQMMSIIACCVLTISMRYHFCLFSALQGVPFIAIQRADKVSDLCWDIDWLARVVPPRFTADAVIDHGQRLSHDAAKVRRHLKESVQKMQARALLNKVCLQNLEQTAGVASPV